MPLVSSPSGRAALRAALMAVVADGSAPTAPRWLLVGYGAVAVLAIAFMVGHRRRRSPPPSTPDVPEAPPPTRPPPEATAPADPPRSPTPPPRRFGRFSRPPWPPDTRGLWRCEITCEADQLGARFHAMAAPPGQEEAREIGRSSACEAVPGGRAIAPTDELCTAVDELAAALMAAGWTPVMGGDGWYADRFVRRGDGPAGADPRPDLTGRSASDAAGAGRQTASGD
jgi:hypothetical protein